MFIVPFPAAKLTRIVPALALLLCGACAETRDPCVAGGETGRKYDAHLNEVYDSTVTDVLYSPYALIPEPTCGSLDMLGPGSDIQFSILASTVNVGMLCDVHEASVTLPATVQVQSDSVAISSSGYYQNDVAIFFKDVEIGSCAGNLELDFRNASGDLSAPPSPTTLPPFVVDRFFRMTDTADCAALGMSMAGGTTCGDTWVATLSAEQ